MVFGAAIKPPHINGGGATRRLRYCHFKLYKSIIIQFIVQLSDNFAILDVFLLFKGMKKIDAERTKTAEQHSCEGYPAVYAGTQGTVFVRSLTAYIKRKSAQLRIFPNTVLTTFLLVCM